MKMTEDWTDYCDGVQAYAEIFEGELTVVFVESLHFHENYVGQELDDLGAHRIMWVNALTEELKRHTYRDYDLMNNLGVYWSGDEQLEVGVYIPGDLNNVDVDNEILWPLFASIMNVSDPGTFGSQYVYDNYPR